MSEKCSLEENKFSHYTVETGSKDKKRLLMLNKLYNPITTKFIIKGGLKRGMTVAEIGCGCGVLACWLAEQIGPKGIVLAIDNDAKQLKTARYLAQQRNIKNIIFEQMCIKDLNFYSNEFDLIYSRWVLMYLTEPSLGVKAMYSSLKNNGIIICEDVDFSNQSVFSFPKSEILAQWIKYWTKNFEILKLKKMDFFNDIYLTIKNLGLSDIKIATNQPILISEDEKSILRLGMLRTKASILKNKAADPEEYQLFLDNAKKFEKADSIIGYVRNILISGRKLKAMRLYE